MKIFHELVLDQYMEDTADFFLNRIYWSPVMGQVESLRFFGVADQVAGTGVNLAWSLYDYQDFSVSHDHLVALLPSVPLTAGQTKMFQAAIAPTDAGMPASYAYLLSCFLTGTAPKAHVRIWATGRGRA
jgi:hypothetical protein